ncbi:MAG: hypothetical protein VZS44_10175 [Bacilli bacterium]|nr:hypothetical protein [Bacilli bacterium]
MYDKIVILEGNIDELKEHLEMNNYDFDIIGKKVYVFTEELDYVVTVLDDHQYKYLINDGSVEY